MLPYIAELIGTMLLILLGDGVVANVTLNQSGMKGGGSVQVTIAWGLAVMVPAMVFGAASGAHFNPALTLALAAGGRFSWPLVPGYLLAQFAGAFLGAVLVWLLYGDHLSRTEDPNTILGCFATGPSIPNFPRNLLSEVVGAFVLVFALLGMEQVPELSAGTGKLLVFGLIVSIGMSLGGLTGYAINPARDLGPRLVHALLPIRGKGGSQWAYGLTVPLFGPVLGALAAVALYGVIPW